MEATMDKQETDPPKKKLFSRFRKSKKEQTKAKDEPVVAEKRQESPSPTKASNSAVTRDGIPVISAGNVDQFAPSDVHRTVPGGPTLTGASAKKKGKSRRKPEKVVLAQPPSARESAFSGPPRYDWIDIETAAAVKVQSAYRRNKVMSDLEKEGVSTQAMRNRARRRKARQHLAASEDTPDLFRCCGVGLIFGDATEEDEAAARAHEKELYEEKKRQKMEREEKLRSYHPRGKANDQVVESLEVAME